MSFYRVFPAIRDSSLWFRSRWTRREQADFYRTVSSFGVVYDPERKAFDWSQFRVLARLERKTDESLERYFNSFVNMCRTACKLPPKKEEGTEAQNGRQEMQSSCFANFGGIVLNFSGGGA